MSGPAVYLHALGVVCALGKCRAAVRTALLRGDGPTGVAASDRFGATGTPRHLGIVAGIDGPPADAAPAHASRNNALLDAALGDLGDALAQHCAGVAPARIGVVIGSSTSGIAEAERAIATRLATGAFPAEFAYGQQELGSCAAWVAQRIGAAGPTLTVSTACSSSAKALASAARMLQADLCDVVIAGGADSLCHFTIAGFTALESVSAARCNPSSANRNGINIGEAAALFVLSRQPAAVQLAGWGESSDAHHISAPDPAGGGARAAMQQALARAGLRADQIDYLNLHGTATLQNDRVESHAVHDLFGPALACSSTKPLTGHALGAAGALEAALCWLLLQPDNIDGALPPHWWDGVADPALAPLALVAPGARLGRPLRHVLSNSFAFGGNNASLLLSAWP